MNILITAANGFLGSTLAPLLLEDNYNVTGTGRTGGTLPFPHHNRFRFACLDITKQEEVTRILNEERINVIVHAAAMSKPDDCELQKELAYSVNVAGTANLLRMAEKQKAFFVFISTDFIFDGKKGMYKEEDSPNPVNYYGRTKWLAELAVQQYKHEWSIIRTSLVYGKPTTAKQNILSIVKHRLLKGEEYHVVDDQVRTPTYVGDLAAGIRAVIGKKATGIFHIAGEDVVTPYQMACKTAAYLHLDASLIKRATAADFSQPANRPANTQFIIDKAKKQLGYDPIPFEEGLRKTFSDQK